MSRGCCSKPFTRDESSSSTVTTAFHSRAVVIVDLTVTLCVYLGTRVCIRHFVTYSCSRQSPVLEPAEVMLHLRLLARGERYDLPMITVDGRQPWSSLN